MPSIVFTIQQGHCAIIERLGKFSRVRKAGLATRLPLIETVRYVGDSWGEVANKRGWLIELTEQQSDTQARQTQTKDNVTLESLDASIYWRILDPAKAVYEIDRLPTMIQDTALNCLRAHVGRMALDELLGAKAELARSITSELNQTMTRWGIQLNRVDIQEIRYDEKTAAAMRQQMDAERKARALVLEAEGEARATVRVAEGDREAAVIRAQGDAQALLLMSQADSKYLERIGSQIDSKKASDVLIAMKYIEGFNTITKGSKDTDRTSIFMPNSAAGLYAATGRDADQTG